MSQGESCKCPNPDLVVVARKSNCSAFNGYKLTRSDYSHILCLNCKASWRTKAKFVDRIPDMTGQQRAAWLLGEN